MNTLYTMPAEWEKQEAIWLGWPHQKRDWPGKFAPIPHVYTEILRHITATQKVNLLVRSEVEKAKTLALCDYGNVDTSRMHFFTIPTNRVWLRDSGPIFVRDTKGKKLMLDWRFNAWAKYPDHKLDDKVPEQINAIYRIPRIQPVHKGKRVVLEGGAIEVNGKGSIIVTEECLQSDVQVRNPGFTKKDYEEVFTKYLGAHNTIWLGHGIVGDDTHGHIDDITRFVSANTIITVVEKNKKDDNHALLANNAKRLKAARDEKGKPFTIVELPMPKPVVYEGQRLPASYANFLITNKQVLVPTFNDAADRDALNILAECFPTREIVGIHSVDLVWGLGTIHCMSQQEPA